jgi:hypothetical protein
VDFVLIHLVISSATAAPHARPPVYAARGAGFADITDAVQRACDARVPCSLNNKQKSITKS